MLVFVLFVRRLFAYMGMVHIIFAGMDCDGIYVAHCVYIPEWTSRHVCFYNPIVV